MTGLLISSAAVFCATNIDDLIVLSALCALSDSKTKVFIGQFVGIAVLIASSLFLSDFLKNVMNPRFLGIVPIILGLYFLVKKDDAASETADISVVSVALLTVAGGGDNVGIYTPFFAVQSAWQTGVTLAVFCVLTAVWCFLAQTATRSDKVRAKIQKSKKTSVPAVFIALGAGILLL